MKKLSLLLFSLLFAFSINAQVVEIEKMPTTVDEFLLLRDNIATTPQGGATMFIIALKMYVENPDIGAQCLVIAADRSMLSNGTVYKNFDINRTYMERIRRQLNQYPYVTDSYFKGATPDNGYTFDLPTQLDFSSNPYSGNIDDGEFKIFVKCYGADNPRPIKMIKNDKGLWKAKEWSSIIMGIRPPVETIDDDL